MAKMSDREIAQLVGNPEPDGPRMLTKFDHAAAALDTFDQKMRKHFEAGQQPGESYEKAFVRQCQESPGLYNSIQKKIDEIKTGNGIGTEFNAQTVGTQRSW